MSGYLNWISVAGRTKDEVLAHFDLVDSGEAIDYPRGKWAMVATTPDGRVVLVAGQIHLLEPRSLKELSTGGALVAAWMEDNDCTSAAYGYQDGERIWEVATGEAELDRSDLLVEGDPPPEFAEIRATVVAEQAQPGNEDIGILFDGPTELAGVIGGWTPETLIGQDLVFSGAYERRTGRPSAPRLAHLNPPRAGERTSEPPLSPLAVLATYAVEAIYQFSTGADLLGRSGEEAHDWMLLGVGVCAALALGCWGKKWSLALLLVPLPYSGRALNLLWALGGEDTARVLAAIMLVFMILVAVRQTQPIWRSS